MEAVFGSIEFYWRIKPVYQSVYVTLNRARIPFDQAGQVGFLWITAALNLGADTIQAFVRV